MNGRRLLALALLGLATVGCDRQESAWQEARQGDTAGAYRQFLEDYPDSPQADEAEQRILELRRAERWQQASATNSIEAYRQFLAEFDEGEEAEQARSRLAELERDREWAALRNSDDIEAVRAFAERHRGDPIGDQARQRVEELESSAREAQAREQARLEAERERRRAEEAARSHRVQLAALDTEASARRGADMLQERLSEVLGERRIEIAEAGRFHVLRTEPLSEEDARALCDQLQANDQECLVVPR